MQLASYERVELADKLIQSIDFTDDDIQQSWMFEASSRLDDVRSGKVIPIPGEDVFAEARARFVK